MRKSDESFIRTDFLTVKTQNVVGKDQSKLKIRMIVMEESS